MEGELPAGSYHFTAFGYQSTNDAHLRATVVLRTRGQPDRMLISADGFRPADAGTNPDLDLSFIEPALCGDELVITLTLVSGSSGYLELGTSLFIP